MFLSTGAIKQCFYRCFTSRFSNVDNLVTVLSSLSSFIVNILEKEEVRTKLEKQFPKENMDCWETLMEICQNIEKGDSTAKIDKVFLILLYQLGLFLFSEPAHVKIATSSIMELKSCYEHYRKGQKKPKAKQGSLTDEPEWIEVLVEVLLSILSAESSVLRSVVQCVFRLLWENLTPSSIGQIVSVLDPESEANPLQESDSEAGSGEESDAEENGVEGSESEEDQSETENGDDEKSDDDEDSNASDDDDVDMKTPDQLRLAVQKALGAAVGSDTESVDADMIDVEEGKKLDDALAEAFKLFHQGKGKKNKKERKDKKALSDFRIRVLDLIDIYLEKDPSMDICLGMIAPLTRCLEFCIQDNQFAELENRVRKTIKLLTKIRKFTTTDDVTNEVLCEYLKATIDKAGRSHFLYQALGDVITFFSTFIIHCSQKIQVKTPKSPKKKETITSPLVEILKEALQNYFQNRSCLLPIIFFHNFLQTEWESNFELVPIVIENVFNKEVRQFRRNEGLELIAGFYRALKRNKPSEKEIVKLSKLEAKFESTLKQTLKDGTEFQVKNNFFVVLKKLINTMKQFYESCHIQSGVDFKSLLDFVGTNKGAVISNKPQVTEVQNDKDNDKPKTPKSKKKKRKFDNKMNGHADTQKKRPRKDSSQTVNL